MTEHEVDMISRYAYRVFTRGDFVFRGITFDDFKEELILLLLERPDLSLSYAAGLLKFSFRAMGDDERAFMFGNIKTFSDLLPAGEEYDADFIDHYLSDPQTDPDIQEEEFRSKYLIYRLAELITKEGKTRERFLDFAFGTSLGSSGNRLVRELLFRHRFDIITFFYKHRVISAARFKMFWREAQAMTEPKKGTRRLKMSSSAVSCRKVYQTHKEEYRAVKREKERQKAKKKRAEALK